MAEFDASIVADVIAACQAGAVEAAGALSRTLDATIELSVGEGTTFDAAALAAELSGPGLAILQYVGTQGAVAFIAESSGLLPEWYAAPDATGTSKLATLAQELGMLLLPEQFMPEDFKAARVPHLGDALERAGATAETMLVPLAMTAGDKTATLYLFWPLPQPKELFNIPAEAAQAAVESTPAPQAAAPQAAPAVQPATPPPPAKPVAPAVVTHELPTYTRSLLRIPVPVIVTLAHKRQPLKKIMELRPGAIIQFEKSCEEMLELEVNGQTIAEGECVKAGDKFGLRITAMRPPDERFHTVRRA